MCFGKVLSPWPPKVNLVYRMFKYYCIDFIHTFGWFCCHFIHGTAVELCNGSNINAVMQPKLRLSECEIVTKISMFIFCCNGDVMLMFKHLKNYCTLRKFLCGLTVTIFTLKIKGQYKKVTKSSRQKKIPVVFLLRVNLRCLMRSKGL